MTQIVQSKSKSFGYVVCDRTHSVFLRDDGPAIVEITGDWTKATVFDTWVQAERRRLERVTAGFVNMTETRLVTVSCEIVFNDTAQP